MRSIRYFLFFLWMLVHIYVIKAQSNDGYNTLTKGQFSSEIDLTHAFSTKFVGELDLQLSLSNDTLNRANIFNHVTQFGFRGWIHYYLIPRLKLSYGLGYWKNTDLPEARQYEFNDFRSSLQVIYFIVVPRITFYHRLRYDDRFVQNAEHTGYDRSWRIWYAPKATYCLNSTVIRKKSVYLILSDELFIIPKTGYWIDLNRIKAGVGYSFTSDIVLEVCYANQRKFTFVEDEVTNTIEVILTINNVRELLRKKQ